MAVKVQFGHVPFVEWEFTCKTPEEKRRNLKIAKEKLNYYLAGYNAALVSLKRKPITFTFKDLTLKRKKEGSVKFLFRPSVFRPPTGGGTDITTSKVPRPQQPNP